MPRRLIKSLIIGLLFFLAVAPAGSASAADQVVVRIPIEEGMKT